MIQIHHLSKAFPGVQALSDISFSISPGEVHGLVGENGAGKSTLIKIFSGIHSADSGYIEMDGSPLTIGSVMDARTYGISTIFQELTVIPELSVWENIFLGREPVGNFGILDQDEINKRSREVLDSLGAAIDPEDRVEDLSIANRQIVEICKALVLNAKIIIMDEPTSSLTENEIEQLFSLIKLLKEQGITVLYVSHKIEEIFQICDKITVFRDGNHIGTVKKEETEAREIIRMMVGRTIDLMFPQRKPKMGEVLLSIKSLNREKEFNNISFDLHAGEILGFAGLIGAGRTELSKAIFGATSPDSGEVIFKGKHRGSFHHPQQALRSGISYLPEDRKSEGIILMLDVKQNITLSMLHRFSKNLFINEEKERKAVEEAVKRFRIKITSIDQIADSLSGGNQQKVVISKLLLTGSDVFIFDEPTRGIDVGAKYEIYQIMNELTSEGKGIIFISSELPEIIGMSDRIMCMREGRLVKSFERGEAEQESIMQVLAGGDVA